MKPYEDNDPRGIQDKFQDIVKAMGDGWRYEAPENDPRYPGCTVTHPTGKSFTLHLDSRPNGSKIEVWGDYPRTPQVMLGLNPYGQERWSGGEAVLYSDEYPKRIYVSPARQAEAIAKDIKSRFLPGYEQAFYLALDRITAKRVSADKTAANIEELAEVLGQRVRAGEKTISWSTYAYGPGYHYADFKVSEDTVTIKAHSLPMRKALAIAGILAGR